MPTVSNQDGGARSQRSGSSPEETTFGHGDGRRAALTDKSKKVQRVRPATSRHCRARATERSRRGLLKLE